MRKVHRSLTGSVFSGGSNPLDDEEPDPMSASANATDAMLVFACGLLLALVSYWNLDLPQIREVVQEEQLTEVTDVEVTQDELSANGSTYDERGTVYEDPETGKLYLLEAN